MNKGLSMQVVANDIEVSDVQYVKNYDERIGVRYEEAKSSYIDAPLQTLVSLRSIVEYICKEFCKEYKLGREDDFASMITLLKQKKRLNSDVINLMRSIKNDGNKAAHKHQFEVTMEQYREMSIKSIRNFCELIESFNRTLNGNFSTYLFEPNVASFLEKLSYKAIFDNDAVAKFKVGTALIEQVIISWNALKSSGALILTDDGKISKGVELIKESAEHRHPDAMFEYGVMLYNGQYIEKDIDKAIGNLYHAADMQHNGAKAFFGYISIEHNNAEDIPYAIDFLKEAAEAKEPLALMVLSELYAEGKHVEYDESKASQLVKEAVKQDYPPALYKLADYKYRAKEVNLAIELLIKAKNLGQWPASLALAKIYSSQDSNQRAVSEYRDYLNECDLRDSNYLNIMFEYAEFKFSVDGESFKSLKEYLSSLVSIYQNDLCSESLMKKIEDSTPQLMKKYLTLFRLDKNDRDAKLFIHFHPDGKPYKDKREPWDNLQKITENPSVAASLYYGMDSPHAVSQAMLGKDKGYTPHRITEVSNEFKRQESIKRKKEKAKTRKANKQKKKQKR